jgi:hypothetical protein
MQIIQNNTIALADYGLICKTLSLVIIGWMAIMFLSVMVRVVSGSMVTGGLVSDAIRQHGSLHRLQLLCVTILVALLYPAFALQRDPSKGLPDIPDVVLLGLVGSHGTYLFNKLKFRRGMRRKE